MATNQAIKIDLRAVLESKLGARSRYVPRFVVRALERLIHKDELNWLLEHNFPRRGADFCRGVLSDLGVRLKVRNGELMPADGRIIVVSNHPLGGLDGIAMIAWLSEVYPGLCPRFVVNDLLMAIEPLTDCFVPVNKHGAQSRSAAEGLDQVLAGNEPVVIYPAGLVSRLGDDGTVADLKWHKMVVNKAIESGRDIVPVFFDGRNSDSFYKWARRRVRMGIRFNYEMILLPREVFRSRNKTFTLTVGKTVASHFLWGGSEAVAQAASLRKTVYSLGAQPD